MNFKKTKSVSLCNIGYSSNIQDKLTMFYMGEIIKIGLSYLVTDIIKIPSVIYDNIIKKQIFTNLHHNININDTLLLIIYIFSFIVKIPVYLEKDNTYFYIYNKKVLTVKKITKNTLDMVAIKVVTNGKNIENIYSLFYVF
jgi:hypothetical protein